MLFEIPGVPNLDRPRPDPSSVVRRKHISDSKSSAKNVCKIISDDFSHPDCRPKLVSRSKMNKRVLCEKLSGARFRQLNELLYTCDSKEAVKYFSENVGDFEHYHGGWRSQQKSGWKIRPIDIICRSIISDFKNYPKVTIADMGCGEASLAELLSKFKNYHVNSFDLVSTKPSVIACDTSKTPLADDSVNAAVFSLSLMNTNYGDSLLEASRILRQGGKAYIAEVESRFDKNTMDRFIVTMAKIGFTHIHTNTKHQIFILMEFVLDSKCNKNVAPQNWPKLKPCIYKRR